MAGGQALLDEFVEIEVEKGREEKIEGVEGAVEEGAEAVGRPKSMGVMADVKDPRHESRCPYCDEWVGRLHSGAIYLYAKHGRLYALADIDHVFDRCEHGLVENIRFLYRMMAGLRARGLRVFAVGKAYDDDLYAWVYDDAGDDLEYDGLEVVVFKAPATVEDFERFSYGLQAVSSSVVDEALRDLGAFQGMGRP